jgi:hypothetical protein
MRALIIGPDEKQAIARVVAYATDREHWYCFAPGAAVPGDSPEYVAHVPDGFRCVFTLTLTQGKVYRHLSVSVNGVDRLPSPEACVALAIEFGFTASNQDAADNMDLVMLMQSDGWHAATNPIDRCVVMCQEIGRGD